MYDSPVEAAPYSPSSYYNELKSKIDEECLKKLNPILDELTAEQLSDLASYIRETANNMTRKFEKTVTLEDFEKAKKEDIDGDSEEGEDEE